MLVLVGILSFGILRFGILGFDISCFGILGFGILRFGILGFGISWLNPSFGPTRGTRRQANISYSSRRRRFCAKGPKDEVPEKRMSKR